MSDNFLIVERSVFVDMYQVGQTKPEHDHRSYDSIETILEESIDEDETKRMSLYEPLNSSWFAIGSSRINWTRAVQ